MNNIQIYTDGSCNTQNGTGAWAAIVLVNNNKIVLSGSDLNTTHNRMELMAVINGIKFITQNYQNENEINIISDSQYVVGLTAREKKFISNDFITKKGNEIRNADLVKEFLELTATYSISFTKIKAHQKKGGLADYNIEADKLCRSIVRQKVNSI